MQGRERLRTFYQSEDPNPTQLAYMEGRKRENSRRQNERADYSNRKALVLLLKPSRPTPSNTEQPRSFQGTLRGAQL